MRLWPEHVWFGITLRRLRIGGIAIGCVSLGVLTVYVSLRIYLTYEAGRAVALLRDVQGIRLGQSESSVQALLGQYGGHEWKPPQSPTDVRRYVIEVDPWRISYMREQESSFDAMVRKVVEVVPGRWRKPLALRVWAVAVVLTYKAGTVRTVSGQGIGEGRSEWLLGEWHLEESVPNHTLRRYVDQQKTWPQMNRFVAQWTHLHVGMETGEGILTWFTPAALPDEVTAARNLSTSCLTSRAGCAGICDLMPDVTRYSREHREVGWGVCADSTVNER